MDNFNKVVSFILGLVVVLVFFAVVTGRLKLPGKLSTKFAQKPTPTPISTVKINENSNSVNSNNQENKVNLSYNNYKTQTVNQSNPKQIPSTGLPTFFIPSMLAGAFVGNFLKKSGKKD